MGKGWGGVGVGRGGRGKNVEKAGPKGKMTNVEGFL